MFNCKSIAGLLACCEDTSPQCVTISVTICITIILVTVSVVTAIIISSINEAKKEINKEKCSSDRKKFFIEQLLEHKKEIQSIELQRTKGKKRKVIWQENYKIVKNRDCNISAQKEEKNETENKAKH